MSLNYSTLTLMMLTIGTLCQFPIPKTQEGYQIGNSISAVKLDVFLDLHCPNSKDFFELLMSSLDKQVNEKTVKELIDIKIHVFPLPYHHNSYLAAVAEKYLELNHPGLVLDFYQLMFNSIPKYTSESTQLDQLTIQNLLIEDVVGLLGSTKDDGAYKLFSNEEANTKARIGFKYGSYLGVTGTPNTFVNNVLIPAQWTKPEDLVTYFRDFFPEARIQTLLK